MKFSLAPIAVVTLSALSASAYTIKFVNNCSYTVWPAVGKAPNGKPDTSVRFGAKLAPKASTSFNVGDKQLGIRAWGRTGCDSNGANCKTGRCNGGLVCNDAGITSNCILSEYGFGDNGPQWGGQRTFWNLSRAGLSGKPSLPLNIPTRLKGPDGQTVACTSGSCPASQCYLKDSDHGAVRNSPLGGTFTHTFCP
ncbi:Osmotin thaumatin-like protein [Pterulicium gracile]|uniref:Osmotin thaumatin-like protein n=2 Tax=Pterulicium gracile TaxID=1884261 RepID=A0A5C3Q5Z0_9AGAR|nr:Osmotin thaumatin-like protein [Pterula gracilis]